MLVLKTTVVVIEVVTLYRDIVETIVIGTIFIEWRIIIISSYWITSNWLNVFSFEMNLFDANVKLIEHIHLAPAFSTNTSIFWFLLSNEFTNSGQYFIKKEIKLILKLTFIQNEKNLYKTVATCRCFASSPFKSIESRFVS